MQTHPLVAISILNWNGWQDTLECLESVQRLDYPNFLTVVVDNGSSNGSADKIKAWAEDNLGPGHVFADYSRETALAGGDPETEHALKHASSSARLVLIRNEENLGFTGGNNVSIHYALHRARQAGFVFLLNNDSRVSANCLTNLVLATQRSEAGLAEATIFGDHTSVPSAPCRPSGLYAALDRAFGDEVGPYASNDEFCDANGVRGAAFLISIRLLREIFSRWGEYLHQRFFMYLEDTGISLRARGWASAAFAPIMQLFGIGEREQQAGNSTLWSITTSTETVSCSPAKCLRLASFTLTSTLPKPWGE